MLEGLTYLAHMLIQIGPGFEKEWDEMDDENQEHEGLKCQSAEENIVGGRGDAPIRCRDAD
jgi:hypothetical protein